MINHARHVLRAVAVLGCSGLLSSVSGAQQPSGAISSPLRISAATGGLVTRNALILGQSGNADTRLNSSPAFSLDIQYAVVGPASFYANGTAAFPSINHGSHLAVTGRAPTSQVSLLLATGGIFLDGPADFFGSGIRPTARLGGGIQRYGFAEDVAKAVIAPTGDFGAGIRAGSSSFEVSAELRYLMSAFDQAKVSTRGIVAQKQQQNSFLFGIGLTIRP